MLKEKRNVGTASHADRRGRRRRPESPWPDDLFTTAPEEGALILESRRGGRAAIDHRRWHDEPGPADLAVLERSRGAVLDIGCGPGRLVHALVQAGRVALGIDSSAAAVAVARRRGAPSVHASVFGAVPAAGQWGTALLIDGNIGIGGDARVLLLQTARLVLPDGLILVEVSPPATRSEDIEVRVDHGEGRVGRWFPWSRIAAGDLPAVARSAGLVLDDHWHHSGRWFAQLVAGLAPDEEAAS